MSRPGNQQGPHRARKRFGQNFLIDGNVIDRIVASIHPREGEWVVEIGPGKGALTARLADKVDHLRVIELDRDLVPWLKVQFERHADFELFQADALKFDFSQLGEGEPLRIVGNLPYNISTPLIFHLLNYAEQVRDMHFMLQKEVVKRLAAGPGEKAYGRLGIMVQYDCQVEPLFEVPPGAFDPAPKVDSAIVRLIPHAQRPFVANNRKTLEQLVNVAFQQRRKTLRNALKNLVQPEQLGELPVDVSLRPDALSLEDYVRLANALDDLNSRAAPPS